MLAAYAHHESHKESFDFIAHYAQFQSSPLIQAHRADFLDEQSHPQPKSVDQARTHPEAINYIGVFEKEVAAYNKRGCLLPPDISIGDIPPELILQLMPIFHKKYFGTDFNKFKCRMVSLGNR